MFCNYECHQVGGPWIAENPACPIHGANRGEYNLHEEVLSVLCEVYSRGISADEAFEKLQEMLEF